MKKYCPNCECSSCKKKQKESFFCLICENELLPYGEDIKLKADEESWMSCEDGCSYIFYEFKKINKKLKKIIIGYEFNIIFKKVEYYVSGNLEKTKDKTVISLNIYDEILSLPFQAISNQQDFESLVPRLLKMKAFA